MLTKWVPALKAAIVVFAIGLVVVAGLVVNAIVTGGGSDTPRSELERGVFAAEEAVKANPKDPAARVKLAAAYLEQKSPRLAEEQARIAVRLAPKEPAAHYILGLTQAATNKNDEAVKTLKKTVAMTGQMAQFYQDAYLALARTQDETGDEEGARKSYQKSIDFGPENALVLFERGQFFERRKQWANAMYDYGWALTYAPNYEPARERLEALAKKYPKEFERVQESEAKDASRTGTK